MTPVSPCAGNADAAVEEAAGPVRGLRREPPVALGVDDDLDLARGRRAEVLDEVGVGPLERLEERALDARLEAPAVVDEEDARARALGETLLDAPLLRGRGSGREGGRERDRGDTRAHEGAHAFMIGR